MKKLKKYLFIAFANIKVLFIVFFLKKTAWEKSDVDFIWNRKFAEICGCYPLFFPYKVVSKNIFKIERRILDFFSYNQINKKIKKNNLVYVSLDSLDYFKRKILKRINNNFILITGDSDLSPSAHKDLLNNKYLLHWFAQNCDIKHLKISTIPIGLDYHTIATYSHWGSRRLSPKEQEKELIEIRETTVNKELKIFTNFHLNINSPVRERLYKELRGSNLFFFQEKPLSRIDTWNIQRKYNFVFSPAGVGMDCHRTWEALILGCIPIVETSFLDDFYSDFPIVIIKAPIEITKDNMIIWSDKYKNSFDYNLELKLKNDYWIEKIKNYQNDYIS